MCGHGILEMGLVQLRSWLNFCLIVIKWPHAPIWYRAAVPQYLSNLNIDLDGWPGTLLREVCDRTWDSAFLASSQGKPVHWFPDHFEEQGSRAALPKTTSYNEANVLYLDRLIWQPTNLSWLFGTKWWNVTLERWFVWLKNWILPFIPFSLTCRYLFFYL